MISQLELLDIVSTKTMKHYGHCQPIPAGLPTCGVWPLNNHPAFDVPLTGDTAIIACHFNPCGYSRPRRNLNIFLDWVWGLRIPLYMVELTYAGENVPVLPAKHPRVLQLQTTRENVLWHKEGLLNAVPRIVPNQFRKLAWMDADVVIKQKQWLERASHVLDQVPIVQLFSRAIMTDADGRESALKPSVGYAAANRDPRRADWKYYHCGFAWAARRELWEQYGGVYHSVIGHGDSILALAAMDAVSRDHTHIRSLNESVWRHIQQWAGPVSEWTKGRLDCIPADLVHFWHGSREDRNYMGRLDYTADLDPAADVITNASGVSEWSASARARKPDMIRNVRDYFSERREDG